MPTQTRTVLPLAQHNNLNVTSASFDVPAGLLAMSLRMTGTGFNSSALTADLNIEESYDNGVTWSPIGGFTSVGGISTKTGLAFAPSCRVDFSRQQRDAAKVRAKLATSGSWVYGFDLDTET